MPPPRNLRINTNVPFPAMVTGSGPIGIGKTNGIWNVNYNVSGIVSGGFPANTATSYVLVWNSQSNTFVNVPLTNFGSGLFINAKTVGAVGDGLTDDTTALQTAINLALNNVAKTTESQAYGQTPLFIPGGNYKITSPLTITSGFGAFILGAGRFSTRIFNNNGTGIFKTNGCQYSQFQGMELFGASGSDVLFDLDWTGTGTGLQSNSFRDMYFTNAAVGLRIGNSGFMGSENNIENCYFNALSTAGIETSNFNALDNVVLGGNFAGCGTGILINSGAVPFISTSFQNNTNWDIDIEGSAGDAYSIVGCRTESINFVKAARGLVNIHGCRQTATTAGTFLQGGAHLSTVIGCVSKNGQLTQTNSLGITVDSCEFGASSIFDANGFGVVRNTYYATDVDNAIFGTYVENAEWDGTKYNPYSTIAFVNTQTGNYAQQRPDSTIIFNAAGTATLTLRTAASARYLLVKTIANQAVVSSAANVIPLTGGAAGTAILPATAGKWARLETDGSNWIIVAAN